MISSSRVFIDTNKSNEDKMYVKLILEDFHRITIHHHHHHHHHHHNTYSSHSEITNDGDECDKLVVIDNIFVGNIFPTSVGDEMGNEVDSSEDSFIVPDLLTSGTNNFTLLSTSSSNENENDNDNRIEDMLFALTDSDVSLPLHQDEIYELSDSSDEYAYDDLNYAMDSNIHSTVLRSKNSFVDFIYQERSKDDNPYYDIETDSYEDSDEDSDAFIYDIIVSIN
jgi:hypothetical protein